MSNFDDIFEGQSSGYRRENKTFDKEVWTGMKQDYNRSDAAFAAYSASYMLCKKYGIDVSGYDFTRLPTSFRESKPQEVRAALTEMRDAASGISARMSRALEQTRSTRGKEQER